MPSLLPPPNNLSRSYTPLADELNPPYGDRAPTVTRNGTVVYGRRTSSYGSDEHDLDADYASSSSLPRSPANETPPSDYRPDPKGKGKHRSALPLPMGDVDLGELQRGDTVRARNPKGKEKAWDVEMGEEEEVVQDSYPPINEVEEEERRIQDNLAKFAARDMARRRAARLSKTLPASPTSPTAPSSTTTSFIRRPFSIISSLSSADSGKRSSVMGVMGGLVGSNHPSKDELPLTSPSRPSYNNPYDPPTLSPSGQTTLSPPILSPVSPSKPSSSPFADPDDPEYHLQPNHHARRSSSTSNTTASSLQSPPADQDVKYGYVGAQWRGGAAAGSPAQPKARRAQGDKWWHALCAWGADLDGGHGDANEAGDQAGRTNPFE
ncbi:hypothetical protein DB88DRAFT_539817 [Papiliotrema laurentii]|uniref:Uncharacterized protein n=1 Tax=Papiliotrema laurentii TaxID=5418 RepID=A0AAD9L711_PAPLA|nr:hypothetical protein DB88DRAFT_539817 [Papiliotrema laurentii]